MKVVHIPKGNRKFRTVYCPDPAEKAALVRLVPSLTAAAVQADRSCVCHAFMPGRSPLTNAMQHRGHRFTLSFDLKDFFDTVSRRSFVGNVLEGKDDTIFKPEYDICFIASPEDKLTLPPMLRLAYARQGLPTSPMIANMAAAPMDEALLALSARSGRFDNSFVYTRYADDLCFSFDDARIAVMLKNRVPEIVKAHGFILNESKTKMQCAAAGRRIICGIAVDDECHPTRHMKRRYRASVHKNNRPQMHGLREWLKLKVPRRWSYDEAVRKNNKTSEANLAALRQPTTPASNQAANPLQGSRVVALIGWARRRFDL